MKTRVIGIGNPVLCDDSVGIHVARRVREEAGGRADVLELHSAGFELLEAMVGCETAILIDSVVGGRDSPGTVRCFPGDELSGERACGDSGARMSHSFFLPTVMELGRTLNLPMPRTTLVWTVEAADVCTFSEEPTEECMRAVSEVVRGIVKQLEGNHV